MNYGRIYDSLILRARGRELAGYSERHHVLPRCMEGTDDPSNIVRLTAEEHFVAHELLVKMHPGNRKLAFSLLALTMVTGKTKRPNNKAFGWIRRLIAKAIGENNTGRPCTPEKAEKIRAANTGRVMPLDQVERLRQAHFGRPKSAAHIAALKVARNKRTDKPMAGKTHSEETKQKMREKATGRKMNPAATAKMIATKGPEQRRAGALKAWETKRAKLAALEG